MLLNLFKLLLLLKIILPKNNLVFWEASFAVSSYVAKKDTFDCGVSLSLEP